MLGFIIALGGGYLVPQLDSTASKPIMKALGKYMSFEEVETRLISFIVAVLAVTIIASIFGSGSTLGIIVGTTIGYFAMRIWAAIQSYVKGDDDEDE